MSSTASPIAAAKQLHRLAEVAVRTGLFLPATAGSITVRCPLPAHGHADRILSMRLYLDDDRYYCFGCGAKGDVVQWVRDAEGLDVAAAIRAPRRAGASRTPGREQSPTSGGPAAQEALFKHRSPGPGARPPRVHPSRHDRSVDLLHPATAARRRRRLPRLSRHRRQRGRSPQPLDRVGHTPAAPGRTERSPASNGFPSLT